MARYQSISYTSGSVSAASSLAVNTTSLPNYFNIISTVVTPNSAGGSFDFKIFKKDTLLAADLLAHWDNSTVIYDPMDNATGTPAIAEEGSPIPYEDEDATNELHVQITNNDSVSHTYTVTILYEEVPLMSSVGQMTLRAGLVATGSGATPSAVNSVVLTNSGAGQSQLWALGPDTSNSGSFVIKTARSNGSSAVDALSFTAAGAATFVSTIQATTITATTAFRAADGSAATPSVSFTNDTNTGIFRLTTDAPAMASGGVGVALWNGTSDYRLGSGTALAWSSNADPTLAGADTWLVRDAANVLALKNGTTSQTLRIYGTTTGPQYLKLTAAGSTDSQIYNQGDIPLRFGINTADRWSILGSAGAYALIPSGGDNSYDLGNITTRIRNTFSVLGTFGLATNRTGGIYYGADAGGYSAMFESAAAGSNVGPGIGLRFAHGTQASRTVVASGDSLGGIYWSGYDGGLYQEAAYIRGVVDGTPGSGDMPGRLEFYTTPDGSATSALALTIASTKAATFAGLATFAAGAAATPSINFTGATTTGLSLVSSNIVLSRAGVAKATFDNDGIALSSSAGYLSIAGDAILTRDAAANRIAQKNGTTAQEFRVYGTTTGPVYSFFGNDGTNGYVGATGDNRFDLYTATTAKWAIGTAANSSSFYPVGGDNSYDLGLSGTRVRSGYFGTAIAIGTSPSSAGNVRIQNDRGVYWRNAADNNDVYAFNVNGSNGVDISIGSSGTVPPYVHVNRGLADTDFIVSSDTNANSYYHDAGLFGGVGAHAWGTTAATSVYAFINPPAITLGLNAEFTRFAVGQSGALTTFSSGTHPIIAGARFREPNITIGTAGVTIAAAVYIDDAPTEGGTNAALYVASGASYFGGNILPLTDNTYTFGDATHRASTMYSLAYDSGNSTMQLKTNGTIWLAATTAQAATFTGTLGVNGVLTVSANTGIGTSTFGTSASMVLGIGNGTAPSTSPADMIQIYSQDISAGNCSLAWRQEMAPYAGAGVASTDKIPVRVNGTVYYILATTVA